MTAVAGVETTNTSLCIQAVIDRVCEYEQLDGRNQLTPGDVISLLEDVCIDMRCRVAALPGALLKTYADAEKRRNDPEYGCPNFTIPTLISYMERALKAV